MTTSQRIVRARDRAGIIDAEIARRCGCPRSTVHGWIHGTHEPTLRSLRAIAKALGCRLADLMGAA
jgi:transcriptional regulator with XRE-family HTH domain